MTSPSLLQFSWTDQGNAEALAFLFGRNIRYCTDSDVWFKWNGHSWEPIHQGEIRQLATKTAQAQRLAWEAVTDRDDVRQKAIRYYRAGENRSRMSATAAVAADQPGLRIKYSQFDSDPWKLGVMNGEIDLRTGEFSPSNPLSYLTKCAGTEFYPQATCPRWEAFINEIFCGDLEMIEVVQRALGYGLTGSTEEQVMFMCVGSGANGKSTLFNVVRRVMGDYSKMTPFSTFNAASRSEQTNDLASLAGARFVSIMESDEDAYLAEAKLKAATGGDPITCRFLNKEFFSYTPQFKVWMSTNQLPGIKAMNHGNFRRQVILQFNATFDGSKRINGLEDILMAERAGILNWMLAGLARWRDRKLSEGLPEVLEEARREYKEDMDIVGKWLEEYVEKVDGEKEEINSTELFTHYQESVKRMGHMPKNQRNWGMEMKARGFKTRKSNGRYLYVGVRLNEEWPVTVNA